MVQKLLSLRKYLSVRHSRHCLFEIAQLQSAIIMVQQTTDKISIKYEANAGSGSHIAQLWKLTDRPQHLSSNYQIKSILL
jgi:hypothetical protein